jgi:murein DD-endopeptidase MepM/ murein hydrolase activator NlpD
VKKWLAAVAAAVAGGAAFWFLRPLPTEIAFSAVPKIIGPETPVRVRAVNPRGVRHLAVYGEQNGSRQTLFEAASPSNEVQFTAGAKLKDGKAALVAEARSAGMFGGMTVRRMDVEVITAPPRLSVDGHQHYINQGGSELVTFTVSGYWTEAGVRVGKHTFRSFALPGKSANERFAIFGFSWDTPAATVPLVYARNPAGTEATGRFWHKVFPKPFRQRSFELPESFLEKVAGEIDSGGTGSLLERFLRINGEMRRQNNQFLSDLRLKTEERVLWHGPFVQLANSQVEAQFADVRTYVYEGKKVDQQTHLGFDLSVTKNTPVLAANDGKVLFGDRLGIYGNCVVIDHGYGLQSIYGHLSEIGVKPGDLVKKGQAIGKSGDTGMAGGDHLHFAMQVDGIQVNPVEWWDAHWLQDRILTKLPR